MAYRPVEMYDMNDPNRPLPDYAEEIGSNATGFVQKLRNYRAPLVVEKIVNQSVHPGGWWAALVRVLLTFTVVALAITFIFLSSFNVWNSRIDYNTDFYGRDCLADDDDSGACIETTLRPQHAVDGNWWIAGGYLASSFGLFTLGLMIYLISYSGLHWDADPDDTDGFIASFNKGRPGLYNAFMESAGMITNEELNGLTVWHCILHGTYTPFLGVLMFARCGVRDFWTLGVIFVLYVFCAVCLLSAQLIIRHRRRRGRRTNFVTAAAGEFGVKSWFMIIIYTAVYLFLWSIYIVYAFKYPHASRDWSFILSAVFFTVIQAVQLVYFLGYFGAHDVRFGGKESSSSPLSVFTWAISMPFRKFGGGPLLIWVAPLVAVLYTPVGIAFGAFYLVIRIATALYLMVDTEGRRASERMWSSNTIFNIALNLLNGVLLFLPMIVLGGMAGHPNIANIKWPLSFSLY